MCGWWRQPDCGLTVTRPLTLFLLSSLPALNLVLLIHISSHFPRDRSNPVWFQLCLLKHNVSLRWLPLSPPPRYVSCPTHEKWVWLSKLPSSASIYDHWNQNYNPGQELGSSVLERDSEVVCLEESTRRGIRTESDTIQLTLVPIVLRLPLTSFRSICITSASLYTKLRSRKRKVGSCLWFHPYRLRIRPSACATTSTTTDQSIYQVNTMYCQIISFNGVVADFH